MVSLRYLPVGFGSHHWKAIADDNHTYFVTIDRLQNSRYYDTRHQEFDRLARAFQTAASLAQDVGLAFVVAPLQTQRGQLLRRIGDDHVISVTPWLEGTYTAHGEYANDAHREIILGLLAQLHSATDAVRDTALTHHLDIPDVGSLESALRDLDQPWVGGPYSLMAQKLINQHSDHIQEALTLYNQLCSSAGAKDRNRWVVTHGEPHTGNFVTTATGLHLVDWESVGIAPPERDLVMVLSSTCDTSRYTEQTGIIIDPNLLNLYHLWWDLAEISTYTDQFRQIHHATADTQTSWINLQKHIQIQQRHPDLFK